MIFGAILAGGIGSRMNISDMPKQFLSLGNKPIIVHTIEKFLLCEKFDKIFVGVHSDWTFYMQDLVEHHNLNKNKIQVVNGGADRNETIFNIIRYIKNNFENIDDNIIVTHDAVRPFVTLRIIEDNIDAAIRYGACDTVVEAIDTIVESEDGNLVSSIPNRRYMYQGQTPQSFKINLLDDLYNNLTEDEKAVLTDACKICIFRNVPVKLVKGEVSNIKITTISDYNVAKAMVGGI